MIQDFDRKKLDLTLFCSKHPDVALKMSATSSKVGASSAYEVNIKIVVHPCSRCTMEHQRIKDAISLIFKTNEDANKS